MLAQVQTWSDLRTSETDIPHRWRLVQLTPQALGQHGKEAQPRAQLGPPSWDTWGQTPAILSITLLRLRSSHAIFSPACGYFSFQLYSSVTFKFAAWKGSFLRDLSSTSRSFLFTSETSSQLPEQRIPKFVRIKIF